MDKVRDLVNEYCLLRDNQYASYDLYAKKHRLSVKELFVLDIVWFNEGCSQSYICERMSTNKQTISMIIKKFEALGYLTVAASEKDKRNKKVCFQLEQEYTREFGKEVLEIFHLQIECARKVKTIEFCQMYLNRGQDPDGEALQQYVQQETQELIDHLHAMQKTYENAKDAMVG